MDSTETLLKELTEAYGVPGYETPVRAVVRKYLESLGELFQDKICSFIPSWRYYVRLGPSNNCRPT